MKTARPLSGAQTRAIYKRIQQAKNRDVSKIIAEGVLSALPTSSNLNNLYATAWAAATQVNEHRYRRETDKWIHAHGKGGKAKVAKAANMTRSRDGAVHHALIQAIIGRAFVVAKLPAKAAGDIIVDGKYVIECKRTLRERRRQIFADGAAPNAVAVGVLDAESGAAYCKQHGAKLVICDPTSYAEHGHLPGVISLDQLLQTL